MMGRSQETLRECRAKRRPPCEKTGGQESLARSTPGKSASRKVTATWHESIFTVAVEEDGCLCSASVSLALEAGQRPALHTNSENGLARLEDPILLVIETCIATGARISEVLLRYARLAGLESGGVLGL